jgi:hypothetical protein
MHFLHEAASYLEQPRFLIRAANLMGKPAERILRALPARAQSLVGSATKAALEQSLEWAIRTLPAEESLSVSRRSWPSGPRFHTSMTATTGALGGMFGLWGAALEIPATTTLMLRSISQMAERNGCDPRDPSVRLQCLSVLSFGSPKIEAMESAYFSARVGMVLAMRDAARYLAQEGTRDIGGAISQTAAPAIVRLINQIASRFEIVISQKLAVQAIPIAGAVMGSLINIEFTNHFNRVAEFHFGIVRLERCYGREAVQAAYQQALDRFRRPVA